MKTALFLILLTFSFSYTSTTNTNTNTNTPKTPTNTQLLEKSYSSKISSQTSIIKLTQLHNNISQFTNNLKSNHLDSINNHQKYLMQMTQLQIQSSPISDTKLTEEIHHFSSKSDTRIYRINQRISYFI